MAPRPRPPIEQIRVRLSAILSPDQLSQLPEDYVRLGDVLILDLPNVPWIDDPVIPQTYAEVLRMRSVLAREGPIEGELRIPTMRHVWGDPNTETTHVENGIKYRLDPAEVMFSPGNLPERRRAATLPTKGETVVDLFAGIGYFAIPIAKYGKPRQVVACEKNPVAYHFLEENIVLNGVEDIVHARYGDNRDTAPVGVADRVMMGYLPDPSDFLPLALSCLKATGGSIHYHTVVDVPNFPHAAYENVKNVLHARNWRATLHEAVRVKSYGPGAVHGVLDVEVRARAS